MRYMRICGLVTLAAAALMVFISAALASEATSPSGTRFDGTIHLTSDGAVTLHIPVTVTCNHATKHGHIVGEDASGIDVEITTEKFTDCGSNHITVVHAGSLEIRTQSGSSNGNGTLVSSGAEISIQVTSLGLTCVYTTSSTHLGTVTGSKNTGGKAKAHVDSVAIPRTGGSFFCGSSGEITGSYSVESPTYLDID